MGARPMARTIQELLKTAIKTDFVWRSKAG